MCAALNGHNVEWLKSYFSSNHTRSIHYHSNGEATYQLIAEWESTWNNREKRLLQWIRIMLCADRFSRPTAASLLDRITSNQDLEYTRTEFCGICCIPDDDTDSEDSILDEPSVQITQQSLSVVITPLTEAVMSEDWQDSKMSLSDVVPKSSLAESFSSLMHNKEQTVTPAVPRTNLDSSGENPITPKQTTVFLEAGESVEETKAQETFSEETEEKIKQQPRLTKQSSFVQEPNDTTNNTGSEVLAAPAESEVLAETQKSKETPKSGANSVPVSAASDGLSTNSLQELEGRRDYHTRGRSAMVTQEKEPQSVPDLTRVSNVSQRVITKARTKPRGEDAWSRKDIAPEEVQELIHFCTHEIKSRGRSPCHR
jgi:hypothetical protein